MFLEYISYLKSENYDAGVIFLMQRLTASSLEVLRPDDYVTLYHNGPRLMPRYSTLILPALISLVVAACDDGTVIRASDDASRTETGEVTLENIRANLARAPEAVDTDSVQIDPGARNINPFKYALEYSYKEREILDGMLEEARQDEGYLERSLASTPESLSVVAPDKLWKDYLFAMDCAVSYDIAARVGLISAYAGQQKAAEFVTLAMDPARGSRSSEELEALQTERAEALSDETPRERYAREQVEKEELNRLRTRNYLNYFLLRDRALEDTETEGLGAELKVCDAALA